MNAVAIQDIIIHATLTVTTILDMFILTGMGLCIDTGIIIKTGIIMVGIIAVGIMEVGIMAVNLWNLTATAGREDNIISCRSLKSRFLPSRGY